MGRRRYGVLRDRNGEDVGHHLKHGSGLDRVRLSRLGRRGGWLLRVERRGRPGRGGGAGKAGEGNIHGSLALTGADMDWRGAAQEQREDADVQRHGEAGGHPTAERRVSIPRKIHVRPQSMWSGL